jgi:hypothetical protein
MKMAKASKADLEMALELSGALDALTGHWGATMPEKIERPEGTSSVEYFDPEDREQCYRVVEYLRALADRASLMRVVFGMAVVCDPRNEVVDPDADTLEVHPKFLALEADANRYRWLRDNTHGEADARGRQQFVMPDPHPQANIMRGSVAQHLDAAIDAAIASEPQNV